MTGHEPTPAPPVRVRPALPEDVPVLLPIIQGAYRGEGGWTTEAHLVGGTRTDEAELHSLLASADVLLLVAEETGGPGAGTAPPPHVLGCCYSRRHGERAEVGLFAVRPSAQGRGVGRLLLEEHATRRAADGVRMLELHVLQSRPELRAWYERMGFVRTGRVDPFPADASLLKVSGLGMEEMVRELPAAPA